MSDTTKGIWLMVLAMFLFNKADAFIKLVSVQVSFGQIMASMGLLGAILTLTYTWSQGRIPLRREMLHPALMWRVAGEVFGSCAIFIALARSDLSLVSAIVQASPILIAVAAAVLLKEAVGWRRWTSIIVGFVGVLLIVNPFGADFDPNSIFAVIALIGLTIRDFSARFVPRTITSVEMTSVGAIGLFVGGLVVMAIEGRAVVPDLKHGAFLVSGIVLAMGGAIAIGAGMRMGDVSAVAPFRYSRMIFAVSLGFIAFGERPTPLMWLGIALVMGSGLFLLLRQRALHQAGAKV